MFSRLQEDRRQLVAARGMIARGWVQGNAQTNGKVCLEAALALAGGGSVDVWSNSVAHTPASLRTSELLVRELKHRGVMKVWYQTPGWRVGSSTVPLKVGRLWRWNDTPGRTKAEVLDLLDVVIAYLDARIAEQTPSRARVAADVRKTRPRRATLADVMFAWDGESSLPMPVIEPVEQTPEKVPELV